jgi:hypothetical protein
MSRRIVAVAVAISLSAISSSAFADEAPAAAAPTEQAAAPAEQAAPTAEQTAAPAEPIAVPEHVTTPAEPVAAPASETPATESSAPAASRDSKNEIAKDAVATDKGQSSPVTGFAPSGTPSSGFGFAPLAPSNSSYDRASTEPSAKRERVRIGALAGVGFPRPFAIEAFAKVHKVVGFGAEYSFLPKMNAFGAETRFKAVAVDFRVFPFKNGLFIGLRGGRQWLDVKTTVAATPLGSSNEAMEASTWFVNPRVGVLHTFESGITVGIDVGVQVPIGASYTRSSSTSNVGTVNGAEGTLTMVANALGNKTTPTVDLLRVGFLF